MAHQWEDVNEGVWGLVREPLRRCVRCGAEQRKRTEYLWMRVTGYKWRPLVGRCKADRNGGES